MYTLEEISNSNVKEKEKSVLRVLKKKIIIGKEMLRDQEEVNLSDCGEKLFGTSDRVRGVSMYNGNFESRS